MDSIKKLTELFSKFPTVGQRTAGRFVYYLVNQPKENVAELIKAIEGLKQGIQFCSFCFQPFEVLSDVRRLTADENLCHICADSGRNRQLLCIVEKEQDLLSIENTKKYKGLYFILGGTITMRNPDGTHLRLAQLKKRVLENSFGEIIVALNPTPEGRSTSVLVERAIKEVLPQAKITHLAQGLPVGGELEYADEETLESAFEGRK